MATFKVNVGGTWKTGTAYVRVGGVWKPAATIWRKAAGAWLSDYTVSVSVDQTSLYGDDPTAPYSVTVGPATATPSGGFGGYSYLWEHVSGSTFTLSNATDAATSFSHNNLSVTGSRSGVYRCRATDGYSKVGYSANVSITMDFGL